ncbi:hypothetical protein FSP39_016344 [Pinctada imbricata]|uniref:Ubiquitin carboxyl-terminal hydrolase n=1 Tax=Pinctada imbricata TaxID=66713 RepID=A0AA88YNG0_PINIB|nr:hypothetical protein FSP39_016344 [Pinctada imbricata]
MNKGWLELESDPGVKGVQVEEIYDLQKTIDGPVYGFIFLFRWIEERRSRRKTTTEDESFVQDQQVVNKIFFAQQVIPNSCATHALLSVLLNCDDRVKLGSTLSQLKEFSKNMSPEDKGVAIGNMPELAAAHNSHARPEPRHPPEKQQGLTTARTMEAFHFVSYVPIEGRLYELDGLKPYPIDHGPWEKGEYWTEKFRRVITERLGMATGGEPYHDIRFNLMAVVPDKRSLYEHKLATLKTNRQIVLETLQQMVKVTNPGLTSADKDKYLAAVRQQNRYPSESSMRETGSTSGYSEGSDFSKTDSPLSVSSAHSSIPDTGVTSQSDTALSDSKNSQNTCLSSEDTSQENVPMETDFKSSDNMTDLSVFDQPQSTRIVQTSENQTVDSFKSISADNSGVVKSEMTDTQVAGPSDVTQPLTIETKYSGISSGPSSESTDTASEVGSCFSSPNSGSNSCQNSPQTGTDRSEESRSRKEGEGSGHGRKRKLSSNQAFSPKDLLALLKNVENEIKLCEANLKDELEKRRKYQIDDCRRTHNYDQFICTFLSMLAKEGHLADLVEKHSLIKKRTNVSAGRLGKLGSALDRRRPRPNRRR